MRIPPILHPLFSTFAVLVVAALLGTGCKTRANFDSHGLKKLEIRMKPEYVGALYGSATAGEEYPATLFIDGEEHEIKISAAGNSSIRAPKKSFNLKLKDGRYRGAQEFRLTTAINDRSLMRPLLSLEVFRAAGLPASWAEPCFAYLNDTVLGLYLAIEKVDADFYQNRDILWDRTYEAKGNADFGPTFEARIDVAIASRPKPEDPTAMIAIVRTMAVADDDAFMSALFRILDRESVIDYMAASQLAARWDGFNKNLFYYRNPHSGRIFLVPWDFDLDWGPDWALAPEAWSLNRLYSRLGKIPSFRAEVDQRLDELLAGDASEAILTAKLGEWKTLIADGFAHDPWLGRAGLSLEAEFVRLETIVRNRIAFLQTR